MLAPLQHFLALRPPLHHLLLRITRFVDTLDRWHPQLLETVEWTAEQHPTSWAARWHQLRQLLAARPAPQGPPVSAD